MACCWNCGAEISPPNDEIFDEGRNSIIVAGHHQMLTPLEWKVLEVLRAREGRNVSKDFIFQCLYPIDADCPDDGILSVVICRVRKVLEKTEYMISTSKGTGYRFERKDSMITGIGGRKGGLARLAAASVAIIGLLTALPAYPQSIEFKHINGGGGGGDGTVTYVGLDVPAASLFSVTGSPILTAGTLVIHTTGVSGGIPYFSSTTQMSSSNLLSLNNPILGGGVGGAPTAGSRSGDTTIFGTVFGSLTDGNCLTTSGGNIVDAGVGCTVRGGTVTEVDTGVGLTGGPITTIGTIALADTAVIPGSYTFASLTVDQQGRLTAASSGAAPVASADPTAIAGPVTVNGVATTYMRSDAAPAVQKATNSIFGIVEVDGVTITAAGGVISSVGAVGANPSAVAGPVAVNGVASTFLRSDGAPAVQKASAAQFGIVEVDGATITAVGGVISATGAAGANPTATASDVAVNGVATTFLRSDGAPAVQKATAGQFGVVEVDNVTITAAGGVISAVAATGANPSATAGPVAVNGVATTFLRSDGAPAVQKASAAQFGIVEVDNVTITSAAGVISSVGAVGANPTAIAKDTAVNGVATTFMRSDGAPAVQKATAGLFGIVEVDDVTITASGGVISAVTAAGANPSATAGPVAVNGIATTYLRSDGAPAVQKGTSAQFGIVEVDNSTITSAAGVISAVATAPGGTTGNIQYNNSGVFGGLAGTGLVLDQGASTPIIYGGASCTNQFPRSQNASGAWTCATVAAADVSLANLTATDTTLTFSGTYNGSVARTIGLNLGNSNSWTAGQAVTPVVLTDASTVTVNAALSNDFTLTTTQAFTLANPTNLKAGQTLNFWITQDGTGGRVMTTGSQYQAAGGVASIVLSTAASAKDLFQCVSDTTSTLTCGLTKSVTH